MAVLGTPVAIAALWILVRNGVGGGEEYWAPLPRHHVHKRQPRRSPPRRHAQQLTSVRNNPTPDATTSLVEACETALTCWEDWAAGESGLNLQAIFAMRNVPAQLRAALARAKHLAPVDAPPPQASPPPEEAGEKLSAATAVVG